MLTIKAYVYPGMFSRLKEGNTMPIAPASFDGAYPVEVLLVKEGVIREREHAQVIADAPAVDAALREFYEDATGDSGVRVVQAVLEALANYGQ